MSSANEYLRYNDLCNQTDPAVRKNTLVAAMITQSTSRPANSNGYHASIVLVHLGVDFT